MASTHSSNTILGSHQKIVAKNTRPRSRLGRRSIPRYESSTDYTIVRRPNTNEKSDVPYKGTLISILEIKPVPIGAVWYPKAPVEQPKRLQVIHFHGSAYVIQSPRPADGGSMEGLCKIQPGFRLAIRVFQSSIDFHETIRQHFPLHYKTESRHTCMRSRL